MIRGGTGPLVYPAGFLYLYTFFKFLIRYFENKDDASFLLSTSKSENKNAIIEGTSETQVTIAQWIFVILYLMNIVAVLVLYLRASRGAVTGKGGEMIKLRKRHSKSNHTTIGVFDKHDANDDKNNNGDNVTAETEVDTIWSWRLAMLSCCLSKRLHSIYVLRLFNDCPAMLLLHLSIIFFTYSRWRTGCILFSLAVSIKMNILLFAPGLLYLLLRFTSGIIETVICLSICALIQILLGYPFIMTNIGSYLGKAFEFDRVFFYKWTVNWKFVPETIFVSKLFSLVLLILHLTILVIFCVRWIQTATDENSNKITSCSDKSSKINAGLESRDNSLTDKHKKPNNTDTILTTVKTGIWFQCSSKFPPPSPRYIIHILFVSNFIGVAFARTLHCQFLSWYAHSVPFLLWSTGNIPVVVRIAILVGLEYAYNIYPATGFSSGVLQVVHLLTLIVLWVAGSPSDYDINRSESAVKGNSDIDLGNFTTPEERAKKEY